MWMWRKMERVKWTDKVKKCRCDKKSRRRKYNAGTDKEEEKKLAGSKAKRLRRNSLLKEW